MFGVSFSLLVFLFQYWKLPLQSCISRLGFSMAMLGISNSMLDIPISMSGISIVMLDISISIIFLVPYPAMFLI